MGAELGAGLLERLSGHELTTLLLTGAAIAAVLVVPRPVWRVTGVWVTLIHELGHALAGAVRGRTGMRIRVRRDHSGLTTSTGQADTVAWTSFWGYPAPPLVGALLVAAAAVGWRTGSPVWPTAALIVLLVVCAAALLFMRGVIAVGTTFVVLAGSLGLLLRAPDPVVVLVLLAVGLFAWAGGLRALANLTRLHLRGRARDSDASALGRLTPLPAAVWLVVFWLMALAPAAAVIVYESR